MGGSRAFDPTDKILASGAEGGPSGAPWRGAAARRLGGGGSVRLGGMGERPPGGLERGMVPSLRQRHAFPFEMMLRVGS